MSVPEEFHLKQTACDKVFSARALFDHVQSFKYCKFYQAIYHYVKGLYCDNNGDLRIIFKNLYWKYD